MFEWTNDINWYDVIKEKESRIISVGSGWLAQPDFVFSGSTDSLFIGSKRYENYKDIISIHSSGPPEESFKLFSDAFSLIQQGITKLPSASINDIYYSYLDSDTQSPDQCSSEQYLIKLNESLIQLKKLKDWELSYKEVEFETKIEEVELEIYRRFNRIEQVLKIYSFEYDINLFHFQILTDNTKYNRQLMVKLLDLEYDISGHFKGIDLSFEYIPKIYESESDVVIKGAKLIYKKQIERKYEFATSTSSTSTPQQMFRISPILASAPF